MYGEKAFRRQPFARNFNLPLTRKVFSSYRVLCGDYILDASLRHYLAAVHACSRTYIDYIIGAQHRFLVVFYHNKRIAEVP